MKKTAFLILILTLLSKTIGFLREIILSFAYGATNISDAYLIAYTIPGVVFAFIGTGIATSFIPMFSEISQKNGLSKANLFTNNLTNLLLIFCTGVIIIGYIFAYPLVKIFASGFDAETMALAVRFTRISILGTYFSVLIHIFSGYLNLKGNYHIPVIAGVPFNLIIAISILISINNKLILLPLGIIVALLSQLLLIMFFVYKNNFKFQRYINMKDDSIKKIIYLSLPVITGVSVNQINVLVDKTIASTVVIGGISALNYANKLISFIQGIFVMSVATAMYPLISKMVVDKNIDGLKKILSEAISSVCLITIPITFGAIIFSHPIVTLLYGRGAFDVQASNLTSTALIFYSIGVLGFGLREILSRVFYAMQDTKTPMINATIGMIINITLNLILSRYLGLGGLALATSIAAIITALLLFINLRQKIGSFGIQKIGVLFLKIILASAIMGLISMFSYKYLNLLASQNLSLLVSIGVGGISYFVIICFMGIEYVDDMVKVVKGRIKR